MVNNLFLAYFYYLCYELKEWIMLQLDDCKKKLADFKRDFGLKFGLVRIGIFGSVVRKENTENSDIDIVVELEKPSLTLMYDLRESLKQLFGCDVDLVRFRDSLRPMLRNHILNETIYV